MPEMNGGFPMNYGYNRVATKCRHLKYRWRDECIAVYWSLLRMRLNGLRLIFNNCTKQTPSTKGSFDENISVGNKHESSFPFNNRGRWIITHTHTHSHAYIMINASKKSYINSITISRASLKLEIINFDFWHRQFLW